jgi:hypothetical protein
MSENGGNISGTVANWWSKSLQHLAFLHETYVDKHKEVDSFGKLVMYLTRHCFLACPFLPLHEPF